MPTDVMLAFDGRDAQAAISRHPELDWTRMTVVTMSARPAVVLANLEIVDAYVTAMASLHHDYDQAHALITQAQAHVTQPSHVTVWGIGG
jgi:hypothetical protein